MCSNSQLLCSQGDPASTAHKNPRLNHKHMSSSRDGTLVWIPAQYFKAMLMSGDSLLPPHPRKRTREMISTICPPLLSTFTEEDDKYLAQISSHKTIPSPVYVPDDVGLGDADPILKSEQPGHHWTSKCNVFDLLNVASTDPHTSSDTPFFMSSASSALEKMFSLVLVRKTVETESAPLTAFVLETQMLVNVLHCSEWQTGASLCTIADQDPQFRIQSPGSGLV